MFPRWLVTLMVSLAFDAGSGAFSRERPNIVLIFTDDQGVNDIGCYGSEIPTPNIDRLAREGVKFTQWYSASSICTPSRYGLLTGRNPSRSRDQLLGALMFMEEADRDRGIHPNERTIASALSEVGYHTALIGKWHLGHGSATFLPTRRGFDQFIGHTGGCIDFFTMTYGKIPDWYHQESLVQESGYATELITSEATHFLKSRREAEEPFFLYLAYNAPHFGKGYSPADDKAINIMQPQAQDLRRVSWISDKVRREFAAMVTSLDDGVGAVLQTLEATGLADNTLVIFLTDHGGDPTYGGSNTPFRGDKATLFEGGLRVPCLMRWPGRLPAGVVNSAMFSTLDLFPTVCDVAGIEIAPESVDGRSILPVMESGDPLADRTLFWELGAHAALERSAWSAVRSGDWKLVQSPEFGEELFNLKSDPYESTDLSSKNPERLESLRRLRDELASEYRPK